MQHGPFDEQDFLSLKDNDWTLLVQAVDLWLPSVAKLKTPFGFLPRWRMDDVMVSYATDGAGVGPHFDHYDVFLIQGLGRRRWRVGERCDQHTPLITESGMKILQSIDVKMEFILEPGDILYLPPRFAHHGESIGNSLCYSIGFRAPSDGEMLLGYAESKSQQLAADLRFEDSGRAGGESVNQLSIGDLEEAFARLRTYCQDFQQFLTWFGAQATQPRYPELIEPPLRAWDSGRLLKRLNRAGLLRKHPASRMAFSLYNNRILLFSDGTSYQTGKAGKNILDGLCEAGISCAQARKAVESNPELLSTVLNLLNQGSLLIETRQE